MKILRIILGVILVLVVLFFAVGALLPKTYTVVRSAEINAPDSVIYRNTADFTNFMKWNPWYKMDPEAKVGISGTPGQPGHLYTWDGKETGQGSMKITQAQPFSMVKWDLNFIKPFEGYCVTTIQIKPATTGANVTWSIAGENRSIAERWMGLMMDGMMGKDFESGLNNLKAISERN